MIEWRDQGTILAVRPHGETSAIVEALTAAHGRHAGVVLGGVSRRMRPFLQSGVEVDLAWRARLEDHLGHFTVEPVRNRAATALGERLPLAAIGAVTALLLDALPEREPHPGLHARTAALLDLLDDPCRDAIWPLAYLRWEVALLEEMGFGLDLSACAVTGAREGLAFLSPRTGRAVSREGAGEWTDRLLPLPPVLLGGEAGDVAEGLRVTEHFLPRLLPEGRPVPAARQRLADLLARA